MTVLLGMPLMSGHLSSIMLQEKPSCSIFFRADPLRVSEFLRTFAPAKAGSSSVVRNIAGVAPPLPNALEPARQHDKTCTTIFHTPRMLGSIRDLSPSL